jgi:hypothetical protein
MRLQITSDIKNTRQKHTSLLSEIGYGVGLYKTVRQFLFCDVFDKGRVFVVTKTKQGLLGSFVFVLSFDKDQP